MICITLKVPVTLPSHSPHCSSVAALALVELQKINPSTMANASIKLKLLNLSLFIKIRPLYEIISVFPTSTIPHNCQELYEKNLSFIVYIKPFVQQIKKDSRFYSTALCFKVNILAY